MNTKTNNKEQLILEVAEKHFIEKGFAGAKTMEIANEAGVNHALLHYYYRTKENLFNRIFEEKATKLMESFSVNFDNDSSFFDKVKNVIEAHFDFIKENPKLPIFILREIIADSNRKSFIINNLLPVGKDLHDKFKTTIWSEMKKGTIRPVKTVDLLLNIISLNVFAFIAAQIFYDIETESDSEKLQIFLEERKKNNVKVIISSLKP